MHYLQRHRPDSHLRSTMPPLHRWHPLAASLCGNDGASIGGMQRLADGWIPNGATRSYLAHTSIGKVLRRGLSGGGISRKGGHSPISPLRLLLLFHCCCQHRLLLMIHHRGESPIHVLICMLSRGSAGSRPDILLSSNYGCQMELSGCGRSRIKGTKKGNSPPCSSLHLSQPMKRLKERSSS